jgi:hypothetical protein
MSTKTLGTIRLLTTKFIELRKDFQENKKPERVYDANSSLNDNGKTRYFNKDNYSLLGRDKNTSMELSPILGKNKYIDIFNATNVLYEEMRQKCINFIMI